MHFQYSQTTSAITFQPLLHQQVHVWHSTRKNKRFGQHGRLISSSSLHGMSHLLCVRTQGKPLTTSQTSHFTASCCSAALLLPCCSAATLHFLQCPAGRELLSTKPSSTVNQPR